MKTSTFNAIVIVLAFVFGWVIFEFFLPSFIKDGGPLVILLIALVIMLIAVIVERMAYIEESQWQRYFDSIFKECTTSS